MTRSRDIANILGRTEAVNLSNAALGIGGEGGDAGSYTAGYITRNAFEWYVRSFQVVYNQITSGRTVEQIAGDHQKIVFAG